MTASVLPPLKGTLMIIVHVKSLRELMHRCPGCWVLGRDPNSMPALTWVGNLALCPGLSSVHGRQGCLIWGLMGDMRIDDEIIGTASATLARCLELIASQMNVMSC
jgi:hypothetical protein